MINSNPCFTKILFSSVIETISAIVPIATKSKRKSGKISSKAWASLNATPTPASFLKGYSPSGCSGCIIAYAFGMVSCILWWSVIMTSQPNSLARSTSSTPAIPLSTVIIKVIPDSIIFVKASLLGP